MLAIGDNYMAYQDFRHLSHPAGAFVHLCKISKKRRQRAVFLFGPDASLLKVSGGPIMIPALRRRRKSLVRGPLDHRVDAP